MRKGREIKNLPVIDQRSGRILGTVSDLLAADEQKLDGLYFLTEDRKTCFLPLERIVNIGRDAVLVRGGIEDFGLITENSKLKPSAGAVVMTTSGRSMGTIDDIVLEEGNIVGFEVSDGHLMDILVGRRIVPTEDIITYGQDTVIINRDI